MKTSIEELIITHLVGELTEEDKIALDNFKSQSQDNCQLVECLSNPRHLHDAIQRKRRLDVERHLQLAKKELKFSSSNK